MPATDSQLSTFLEKTAPIAREAQPADAAQQPKVPFQTDLKLTGPQETRMLEHAFRQMKLLESESGRDETLSPTWWFTAARAPNPLLGSQGLMPGNTFMGKRSRYDATFYNDVSWRPFTMGSTSIFNDSNMTVPLSRRICRQMIARAKNAFFGSEPWFSCNPAPSPSPEIDEALSRKIEAFARYKLKESKSKEDKERAISRALILGECPVKTSYVVRDQLFNVEATVLTDVDGNPVQAMDGNHITPEDTWVDAEDGTGQQVLARDGQTPAPDSPIWQKAPLNRRQVLFEGAKTEPIYFKDFLCPLTAPDVQQAHTIIHLYDKPVMEFVDLVVKRGMVGDTTDERKGAAQKMVALVTKLANNSPQPKSAQNQDARPSEAYNVPPQATEDSPVAEFAEFYMWYDANEDGIAENIMLIADRKNRAPIFYDHVANVTTDGLRPIDILRINPVEGRWYGLGIMELFESYQTVTDLLVNRWNFSQSRSGRVDFWNPSNTLEGDRDPNLKMNWGQSYTLKPGMKPEDTCQPVYLNDTKFEAIHEMIQFFMQLAMNESGVTNANDDQAAGMQSAKLATGIMQVQQSGDELFKPILGDLRGPLSRILDREIDVTLANINSEEAFTYLQGQTMGIDRITPDEVRGLKFKVEIELTTHKNQEIMQSSAQAIALITDFYSKPPEIQVHVAEFYRQELRALNPKTDADKVIVVTLLPMAAPGADASNPGAPKIGDPTGGKAGAAGAAAGKVEPFPAQMTQQVKPKGAAG